MILSFRCFAYNKMKWSLVTCGYLHNVSRTEQVFVTEHGHRKLYNFIQIAFSSIKIPLFSIFSLLGYECTYQYWNAGKCVAVCIFAQNRTLVFVCIIPCICNFIYWTKFSIKNVWNSEFYLIFCSTYIDLQIAIIGHCLGMFSVIINLWYSYPNVNICFNGI